MAFNPTSSSSHARCAARRGIGRRLSAALPASVGAGADRGDGRFACRPE